MGRSLHLLLSRAARGARRGHAGRRPATLVVADAGNPFQPASNHAFHVKTSPQRRGLRPLREERWGCQKRAPPDAPPPFSVAHEYDGTALTPRGGNRRSIPLRPRSLWRSTAALLLQLPSPCGTAPHPPTYLPWQLLEKEVLPVALIDKLDRSFDRDQDRTLLGLLPRSPASSDCTAPPSTWPWIHRAVPAIGGSAQGCEPALDGSSPPARGPGGPKRLRTEPCRS